METIGIVIVVFFLGVISGIVARPGWVRLLYARTARKCATCPFAQSYYQAITLIEHTKQSDELPEQNEGESSKENQSEP